MNDEEDVPEAGVQHILINNLELRDGFDFVYALKDKNWKSKVADGGGLTIPRTILGILKSEYAWSKINYISFEKPSRCVIIGLSAFWHSDLCSIHIPASVKIMDRLCLSDCHSLRTVSFEKPSQLHEIREDAFSGSAMVEIEIPASVALLGKSCFTRCKALRMFSIEAPSNLRMLKEWTFGFNEMRYITIPRSIEVIHDSCFYYCEKLDEITFEKRSSLRRIGNRAFMQCAVVIVEIPGSVVEIGSLCFGYCSRLYKVTFDENGYPPVVRRITSDAFKGSIYAKIQAEEAAEKRVIPARGVSGGLLPSPKFNT